MHASVYGQERHDTQFITSLFISHEVLFLLSHLLSIDPVNTSVPGRKISLSLSLSLFLSKFVREEKKDE